MEVTPPVSRVEWKPCWRIIPGGLPSGELYERVSGPGELERAMRLEALTNPNILGEVGEIGMVPKEDRISGPGTGIIMLAFTHINPDPKPSRFSDGNHRVFYAAKDLETAVAETKYHRERFMRTTNRPEARDISIGMQAYHVDLAGDLHDLRGRQATYPDVYHESEYAEGQRLGKSLCKTGSNGIVYDAVRRDGGENVAIFRPPVLSNARLAKEFNYFWDGECVSVSEVHS